LKLKDKFSFFGRGALRQAEKAFPYLGRERRASSLLHAGS
jgi:hypothetical protein